MLLCVRLLLAIVSASAFSPSNGLVAQYLSAPCITRSSILQRMSPASPRGIAPARMLAAKTVVVTDMDETLISKKSTGYIIKFLLHYGAYLRLFVSLPLAVVLIPLSKVSRSLAVRILYWLAFRGISVQKAQKIAAGKLCELYAADLQDPAASAVLSADDSIVITASPDFMARPWLGRFLRVAPDNVYGAVLEEKNGRYTGRTGPIPIGQRKVDLLINSGVLTADTISVGYGDHPTDVPFLLSCDRGVLVHPIDEVPAGIVVESSQPFDTSKLGANNPLA